MALGCVYNARWVTHWRNPSSFQPSQLQTWGDPKSALGQISPLDGD